MKEITGHTILTGLLGSPVTHSISPLMHNASFQHLNLDYVYLAFDANAQQMESAVAALRVLNARGFNVTMPGKQIVARLCDHLSPAASICGAVNTVVIDNGVLTGHTTDGIGFMRSLQDVKCNVIGKKITLLGVGGASTSILVQAALDGVAEISVFNRKSPSFEHAKEIIQTLTKHTTCKIQLFDLADQEMLRREINESVLLVNGTSIGMAPNTDASIITDASMFHKHLVVADVIYNPRETKFLQLAKSAGCQTMNGLGMLLYQGAEAFKLWTNQNMPIELIKDKYFCNE